MMSRLMNALLRSKFLARASATMALLAVSTPVTWALQEAEAPATPSNSLFDYIRMSGFIGWCICVLSVIALAMVLENIVTLRREKLAPPELVDEVQSLFDEGQYQEAMELCENDKSFFARVCAAGIA